MLQDLGKDAGKRFFDSVHPGTLRPLFRNHLFAVLLVLKEDFMLLPCHNVVIHEGIDFEVLLKAAEVDIGRTDSHETVIDDQGLGMKTSFFVKVHLDTGSKRIGDVRTGCPWGRIPLSPRYGIITLTSTPERAAF